MPKITKGHNSWSNFQHFIQKLGHLFITNNLFIKFQGSSFNSFWDILLTREKCPNLQRAITQGIFFRIYSKVNQVIYSSLSINSLSFMALAPTILRHYADKVKMPSYKVYSSSFKALASIVFEIFCWQISIYIVSKGHNSGKRHYPVEKKKISVSYFFHEKPIHEISKL